MLLDAVFFLIDAGLRIYSWMVIAAVIVQVLIQFNVLDTRNQFVHSVADFLYKVTEPVFRRVRRYMPDLGSIDLSPLVVILLLQALQYVVVALRNYMIRGGLYF